MPWPAPDGAAAETAQLSQRELDVVRQVAQGLSNAEIAGQLYLSEATVKRHIARILAKLGLRTECRSWSSPTRPASSGPADLPGHRTGNPKQADGVDARQITAA